MLLNNITISLYFTYTFFVRLYVFHPGVACQDLKSSIEIQPQNTAGELGSDVILYCKWNNRNNGSVTWRYYDPDSAPSGTRISLDS